MFVLPWKIFQEFIRREMSKMVHTSIHTEKHLLSPWGVQQKSHQSACTRTSAIIGEQRIFEFIFAHNVFSEFHVQLVFGSENLNVLRNIRSEIFDSPRPQNCVFVCGSFVCIISCSQYETCFGFSHSRPSQVTVLQTRSLICGRKHFFVRISKQLKKGSHLYVDYSLRPYWHL